MDDCNCKGQMTISDFIPEVRAKGYTTPFYLPPQHEYPVLKEIKYRQLTISELFDIKTI